MKAAEGFWLFQVVAYSDESFGHFLGRFRRENALSRPGLAELLCVSGALVRDWETPSRQHPPTESTLKALSNWVGVTEVSLSQMLPPEPAQLYFGTRLCPTCYREVPIHRQAWQYASVDECERHRQPLLRACPACQTSFRLPALWELGICEHCWLRFSDMTSECSTSRRG